MLEGGHSVRIPVHVVVDRSQKPPTFGPVRPGGKCLPVECDCLIDLVSLACRRGGGRKFVKIDLRSGGGAGLRRRAWAGWTSLGRDVHRAEQEQTAQPGNQTERARPCRPAYVYALI